MVDPGRSIKLPPPQVIIMYTTGKNPDKLDLTILTFLEIYLLRSTNLTIWEARL